MFDGVAALLSLAPQRRAGREEPEFDEAALGPPTVTLRSEHALEPPPGADDERYGHDEPSVESTRAETEPPSAEDAEARFEAGAELIQIYTGFVYRGPSLLRDIVARL